MHMHGIANQTSECVFQTRTHLVILEMQLHDAVCLSVCLSGMLVLKSLPTVAKVTYMT